MRIISSITPAVQAWSIQDQQLRERLAAHQSTPRDRPIEPPGAIGRDTQTRRPSRHTFDIRV
jgi:hypothetical protein